MSTDILDRLYDILQDRKNADPESSYVASLYDKGASRITDKIREEAEEAVVEALRLDKSPRDAAIREALCGESADLLFHLLVMLAHHDIRPEEVLAVLESRFGTSGHAEKAVRG